MLEKIRSYLTPMVATVAFAVLGATALAVTPEIVERLSDESVEEELALNDEPEDVTEVIDLIDQLEEEELVDDPLENEEDVTTPDVTPDVDTVKPNHGHYVSCVARMAKSDPTLQGRQKGAVVSYAAKQDVEMIKGDEAACTAAYAAARAAALPDLEEDGDVQPAELDREVKQTERQVKKEVPARVPAVGSQKDKQQGEGGRPDQPGRPASQNANANAQKGGGGGPR